MIDERMEEQASLHVLGALTEAESREFKRAMAANTELQELVARLSAVAAAMSGTVPLVEPPPQLRANVLSQVAPSQKIVRPTEQKSSLIPILLWGLAGCLAVVLLVVFTQEMRLRKTVGDQAAQIGNLTQLAQSLESATNELRRTVLALQETNRLVNLRIAMLDSLAADAPKTVAVTLWDNQKQDGVLVAENLKPLAPDQDYELWVIDENQHPVAAGVFHVDDTGKIKMDFKPRQLVKTAGMFAITTEAKGGVASPTMKNMVLAGK
ncbi:MAG TPA: anti-sigma factor [Verrucomicrobiae bacterium]|jgi:anti-sigma-K factor RskA|nr:anti-sigma factor [Verrucomicrobiae bacterium]